MITVYRITKKKHAGDPLGGNGGLYVGGRWHHKGSRIAYCAESVSLAALELFVHIPKAHVKIELALVNVDFPDEVKIELLDPAALPDNWNCIPSISETADLGNQWLAEQTSVALRVPSAISRGEHNFLINPLHPDFAKIKINPPAPYSFDPRMWKIRD